MVFRKISLWLEAQTRAPQLPGRWMNVGINRDATRYENCALMAECDQHQRNGTERSLKREESDENKDELNERASMML